MRAPAQISTHQFCDNVSCSQWRESVGDRLLLQLLSHFFLLWRPLRHPFLLLLQLLRLFVQLYCISACLFLQFLRLLRLFVQLYCSVVLANLDLTSTNKIKQPYFQKNYIPFGAPLHASSPANPQRQGQTPSLWPFRAISSGSWGHSRICMAGARQFCRPTCLRAVHAPQRAARPRLASTRLS